MKNSTIVLSQLFNRIGGMTGTFLCMLLVSSAFGLLVPSVSMAQWSGNPKINNLISNASSDQINPASVSDGNGGAITVWQDKRSGNYDIYAQRIGSNGTVQWASNGVVVCSLDSDQVSPA